MESINTLQTQTQAYDPMGDQTEAMIGRLLSTKPALLSNPGSVTAGNLYYDSSTCTVVASEAVQNAGRYSSSFNSLVMGSTSSITIPNSSFLQGIYVYAELPALPAGVYLPRGWLLNAIDNISFLLGSSNVSQIQFNGASHAAACLLAAETEEKRRELLQLAGESYLVANLAQQAGFVNKAYVQLQLPFSRIGAIMKKLPFDTSLLSSPIIVNIQWKPATQMFSGPNRALAPQQFGALTAYASQIDLMDKDQSLKLPMMRDPTLIYSYPFTMIQSVPAQAQGSTNAGSPAQLSLTGIINADLVGIGLQFIKSSDLVVSANGGNGSALNPFNYESVENIVLAYNGLVLYNAPGQMSRLYDIQDMQGSSLIPYETYSISAGPAPPTVVATPTNSRCIFIPFTRIRNTMFVDYFQNSFRIANNALQLSFTTRENVPYNVFVSYYYNAAFCINQGVSNLVL